MRISTSLALAMMACTPQSQRVIDVLCRGDLLVQPIVVPVVVMASPLAGPAQPAVAAAMAVDQVILHPAVVKACAEYDAKPVGEVPATPAGAKEIAPVTIIAPAT
jgi:hypothetical protein